MSIGRKMVTVGFVAEAQWTAKRAFDVYHNDVDDCSRGWKDEGVVVKVYTAVPRAFRLGSNVAGFKVVADLELRHPPTITTQSYTV
jgi:hypothetical protein